jgi:conjugative transfer signal peptidase TraF
VKGRRLAIAAFAVTAAALATYGVAKYAGLVINTTESLPTGLWRTTNEPVKVERGAIVLVTPPDNAAVRLFKKWGYAHHATWLKPIAAIPGDTVDLGDYGIQVNGRDLANSAQLVRDGAGRLLPRYPAGHYIVAPGTVWLVSDYNHLSLDSRYFGPVPIANLIKPAHPVWIHSGPLEETP